MNHRIIPIAAAKSITGGCTQTSKMPCKSYSLPTLACKTGHRMAQIEGSICSMCYADKGFYRMYEATILPVQMARLDSITDTDWVSSMAALIGSDSHFRWHDSGDLQNLEHLEKIAAVCLSTPNCKHWLPTREHGTVKDYIAKHGAVPANLTIRLSAMYADKDVVIPASLRSLPGITTSNVHHKKAPVGSACNSPDQGGECLDCRKCWTDTVVSYELH